jgi:hypothetical protein
MIGLESVLSDGWGLENALERKKNKVKRCTIDLMDEG